MHLTMAQPYLGASVRTGMRTEEQLYIFRPLDHYRRFLNSARLLNMEFQQTPEDLAEITVTLLRQDGYHRDVYIRPLAYKADETIGVKLHELIDEISIVAVPLRPLRG